MRAGHGRFGQVGRKATLGLCVAAMLAASAGVAQARETRHLNPGEDDLWITRGYTVHPCQVLELRPNVSAVPAEHRDLARGQLREVVEIYNQITNRDLFRVGADTTATWTTNDGVKVVEMTTHGDPEGDTSVARYVSGRGRVVATGIVDGGRHITDLGVLIDLELNPTGRVISIDTLLHELGHGLGFHHTIDGRSIMSYNFSRANHYPDTHDERRFGPAYLKALRHLLPADCAYATISQAHDWRKGGPAKDNGSSWYGPTSVVLDDWVENVQDIGMSLLDGPQLDQQFVTRPSPKRVVICRDDLFADCLGGSALAGQDGAVLFVEGGPNGQITEEMLRRFQEPDMEISILGGPNAVSVDVEEAILAWEAERQVYDDTVDWTVERISGGPDTGRFGTATAIADAMLARGASDQFVLIARSDNPVDAVAAGAFAAREGLPILLTLPGNLHEVTEAWLAEHKPARAVVLGGEGAVQEHVATAADTHVGQVERAWGRNRRATSVAISEHPWMWGRHVITDSSAFYLVNGDDPNAWALALAAAPWAAQNKAPILLTSYDHLGMTQQGGDGAADPGWYLWNLDAVAKADYSGDYQSDSYPKAGFFVLGTDSDQFSHSFLGNTAQLTFNAQATYENDGG